MLLFVTCVAAENSQQFYFYVHGTSGSEPFVVYQAYSSSVQWLSLVLIEGDNNSRLQCSQDHYSKKSLLISSLFLSLATAFSAASVDNTQLIYKILVTINSSLLPEIITKSLFQNPCQVTKSLLKFLVPKSLLYLLLTIQIVNRNAKKFVARQIWH